MAGEIQWPGILTGATEYFCLRKPSTYQYWNTNSSAWENFTVANWNLGYYSIALTETPSGGYHFIGTWPAAVTAHDYYYVEIYKRVGASVAIGDKAAKMGEMLGYWDGTNFRAYKSDMASVAETAQTARDLGLALPAVAPKAKGGFAVLDASAGTQMIGYGDAIVQTDLPDAPNIKAAARIKAGADKCVVASDGKTITLKTAANATIATLTTSDFLTWTLTVS